MPLVWVLTVAAMALGVLVFRRGRPGVLIDAAIVAVVPVVLLLPWSIALATHPSQLLLEAGLQPPGLASPHLAARSLMLLSPGGPGLPPFWVTAGLILAAAVALVASGRRALVLAGWAAALLGLLAAAALSKLIVTPAVGGDPILAWPGLALAFAGAGLLLAVLACGDLFQDKLRLGRVACPERDRGPGARRRRLHGAGAGGRGLGDLRGPGPGGPVRRAGTAGVRLRLLRHRAAPADAGAACGSARQGGVFGAARHRPPDRRPASSPCPRPRSGPST